MSWYDRYLTPIERIEKKLVSGENGCLNWTGTPNYDGYCFISIQGIKYLIHRVISEHYDGPIPEGILVLHKCDNRRCGNKDHLFRGTDLDNKEDAMSKRRHTFGTRIHTAVINDETVPLMRNDYEEGMSTRQIAVKYGLGKSAVHKVVTYASWTHV